jgi:ABC-type dipeptide/oligopeptide/nickel transport system permease subunit
LQASNAFLSAGAASPDEFYDLYTMDLEPEGQWTRAWRRFRRHRLAMASLVIITIMFAAGFLASRLAPYGYEDVNINALSAAPSWAHPFGTDQVGRDYFSRTLHGLRTEAEIALLIGFFGTLIGVLVGASAGYLGGFTDRVVMRLVDLLLTVPPLVVVLLAASFFKTNTLSEVSLLFAAVLWMPVARVVRSATLVVREQEYVQAARAMGAGDLRIIRRHVLPNVVGAAAVAGSVLTASAVILETTLSYLGLGSAVNFYGGRTDTKLPSVGDVLAAASNEGLFHWWGIVFPGIAIILIVAPIYFIGDGIRDALDPTQRRYVSDRELARRRRGPSRLTRLVRAIPRPSVSVRIRAPQPVLVVADALARRRARRSRPRLLVELAVVCGSTPPRTTDRPGRRRPGRRSGLTPASAASPLPPSTRRAASTSRSRCPERASRTTNRLTSWRPCVPGRRHPGRSAGSARTGRATSGTTIPASPRARAGASTSRGRGFCAGPTKGSSSARAPTAGAPGRSRGWLTGGCRIRGWRRRPSRRTGRST